MMILSTISFSQKMVSYTYSLSIRFHLGLVLTRLSNLLFNDSSFPSLNTIWYVSFKGVEKTLYANEDFKLKFVFEGDYVIIF